MVFERIKKVFSSSSNDGAEEYVEIDLTKEEPVNKIMVKLFELTHYDDVNNILNSLREGYTIAIINIKVLRQKDSIELKRAISKIKKTTDALEGNIAGFGENMVIVTPAFARIHKEEFAPKDEKPRNKFDYN
ncbi:MAG: cell division protein SepF [Nanoarchaeota archaeon]|nr:cell division protein SepF [Nanoarchaeota archaeon]